MTVTRLVFAVATFFATLSLASAQAVDREARAEIEVLKKAMTDAGRSLMFRAPVASTAADLPAVVHSFPRPMPGPVVVGVVRAPAVAVVSSTGFWGRVYGTPRTMSKAVYAGKTASYGTAFAPVRRLFTTIGGVGKNPD
jgi:hypothetical protein